MKGDAAEGVGVRRGQRSVTWEDSGRRVGVMGPELKGQRADGLWENEFGRGLIHYSTGK